MYTSSIDLEDQGTAKTEYDPRFEESSRIPMLDTTSTLISSTPQIGCIIVLLLIAY